MQIYLGGLIIYRSQSKRQLLYKYYFNICSLSNVLRLVRCMLEGNNCRPQNSLVLKSNSSKSNSFILKIFIGLKLEAYRYLCLYSFFKSFILKMSGKIIEVYMDREDYIRKTKFEKIKHVEDTAPLPPSDVVKETLADEEEHVDLRRPSFTLPEPRAPDITHSVSKEIDIHTSVRKNSITDAVLKNTARSALRSSIRSLTLSQSHAEGEVGLPCIYLDEHGEGLYINENNPQLNQDTNISDDKIKLFKFDSATTITSSVGISPRSDYSPSPDTTNTTHKPTVTDREALRNTLRNTRYSSSQIRPPPILRKMKSEYDINDTPSSDICNYCSALPIVCFVFCISCVECKCYSKAANPDYNYNYKEAIKTIKLMKAMPRITR